MLLSRVTALCAISRPWIDAPVTEPMAVMHQDHALELRRRPDIDRAGHLPEDVLRHRAAGECDAHPVVNFRFWAIWKIQTSVALPASVTLVGIRRPEVHL